MIEKIKEECIWKSLKDASLPIVLYGMGNGADMIIDVLNEKEIPFADIFASDEFVRGHSFHGIRVKKLSEIEEMYNDFIILMTFGVHDNETLEKIRLLSCRHTLLAPTVPIRGTELFTLDYIKKHDEEFERAYSMLEDNQSKKAYLDILNFKVSGKVEYLYGCSTPKSELYENVLRLTQNESILDLGAYDADTIREFLSVTNGQYKEIFAFEADSGNYKKLLAKTEGMKNITTCNMGAWSKKEIRYFNKKGGRNSFRDNQGIPLIFDSVDNVISSPVTFVKMDIEGDEKEAIEGMRSTITKYKPKMYVCAYHRNEDMFELVFKVKEICPQYRVYFRHHPYIPSWESNLYFVI